MAQLQGPCEPDLPSDPPSEPPILHSHVAYFFIPLPEPLGLPDKHVVRCAAYTGDDWYRQDDHDHDEGPPPPVYMAASLLFHRTKAASSTGAVLASLFELAHAVMPADGSVEAADTPHQHGDDESHSPPTTDGTVVEVAVPFDFSTDEVEGEDEWADVTAAFDAGLNYVREVQRAYFMARRRPLRLVTRESLPFAIPMAIRPLYDDDGELASFRAPISTYLLHQNLLHKEFRDADLNEQESSAMDAALIAQGSHGVFRGYADFVREADVALNVDGAYRAAVLFNATACEVLFDELLAHMLWEERSRPEEAADIFDSWLTSRVKTKYHQRLGGRWAIDQPGPIAAWSQTVAALRNRVVHGGYEPTLEETRDAFEASGALETYLCDLVANKVSAYPRTALALPGAAGLRKRGKWTGALDRLADDPAEVDWRDTFVRWRETMQRLRADSPLYVTPSVESAYVVLIVWPDGATRWIIHDQAAKMAARLASDEVQDLLPDQRKTLDAVVSGVVDDAPEEPISIDVAGASAHPDVARRWLPEYRLVPMAGVMVDGRDLDPP